MSLLFVAGCKRLAADASPVVSQPVRVSAPDTDSAEPVTAAAPDGSFFVAWVNHDVKNQADVIVTRFNNDGVVTGQTTRVNRQPGVATAWRGDQPGVAVAGDAVYVLWTARVESGGKKGTDLYLSVSHDRGQSFTGEVKVNDDKTLTSHGMHSVAVGRDGRIYIAWLDERNVPPPPKLSQHAGHHTESNSELFTAYSTDGGKTFSANRKVASETCPCCKTALTIAADGTVYVGWRQVLPGSFRHIAVASSTDGGVSFSSPVIVSDDKWVLQGCPVSGPSLSTDTSGNLKVAWYAAGEGDPPGLYFAESRDKGRTFSPRSLLVQENVKGTPALVTERDRAIAVWQGLGAEHAATKIRELGGAHSAVSIAANAELPAGVLSNNKLFVAYIQKMNEKRSVWLVRVGS